MEEWKKDEIATRGLFKSPQWPNIMAASLAPVLLAIVFWKAARTARYSSIIAMILGALTTIYGIVRGNSAASTGEGGVVFVWALDPILMGLPVTLIVLII